MTVRVLSLASEASELSKSILSIAFGFFVQRQNLLCRDEQAGEHNTNSRFLCGVVIQSLAPTSKRRRSCPGLYKTAKYWTVLKMDGAAKKYSPTIVTDFMTNLSNRRSSSTARIRIAVFSMSSRFGIYYTPSFLLRTVNEQEMSESNSYISSDRFEMNFPVKIHGLKWQLKHINETNVNFNSCSH